MRARCLSPIALLLSILPSTHPSAETLGDARVGFTAERVLILDGRRFVGRMWHMPSEQRHEQDFPAMHLILILRRVVRAPGAAINSESLERIEFRHSRISTRDLGARALCPLLPSRRPSRSRIRLSRRTEPFDSLAAKPCVPATLPTTRLWRHAHRLHVPPCQARPEPNSRIRQARTYGIDSRATELAFHDLAGGS